MIRYQLGCTNDHGFESWFRDSASFDAQVADGLLTCPVCGSEKVAKSIMAPAVVARTNVARPVAAAGGGSPATHGEILDARQQAVRTALRALRTKILSEGQDVGARFPEEARRMHEGDIPARPIHGQATPDEARGLIEDGVMIMPVPVLPEELN